MVFTARHEHRRQRSFRDARHPRGQSPDATTSAVMTPVYLTSKYAQDRSALTQALDRA